MFGNKPKRFLVIQQMRRIAELERKDTIIQDLSAVEARGTTAYNHVHGLMTYDDAIKTARLLNENRVSIMNRPVSGRQDSYVYLVIEVKAEFWTEHSYAATEHESLL